MPLNRRAQGHFVCGSTAKALRANRDYAGLAYHLSHSRRTAMPGNVPLPMAISADKPLLVKAVGMLRNAWEVYRFVCGRLLGHHFSALFASFSRHCSSLLHTVIWNTMHLRPQPGVQISNFGNCCRLKYPRRVLACGVQMKSMRKM